MDSMWRGSRCATAGACSFGRGVRSWPSSSAGRCRRTGTRPAGTRTCPGRRRGGAAADGGGIPRCKGRCSCLGRPQGQSARLDAYLRLPHLPDDLCQPAVHHRLQAQQLLDRQAGDVQAGRHPPSSAPQKPTGGLPLAAGPMGDGHVPAQVQGQLERAAADLARGPACRRRLLGASLGLGLAAVLTANVDLQGVFAAELFPKVLAFRWGDRISPGSRVRAILAALPA